MSKEITYPYDDQTLTHQPRVIYDDESTSAAQLYWDANGNLLQIEDGAMTKFMQNYLKNGESGIKQFLKQCEQQSRNTDK